MPIQVLPDIPDNLTRLVIHGSEFRLFSDQESVNSGRDDEIVALKEVDERQEYLIGYPSPGIISKAGLFLSPYVLNVISYTGQISYRNTTFFNRIYQLYRSSDTTKPCP